MFIITGKYSNENYEASTKVLGLYETKGEAKVALKDLSEQIKGDERYNGDTYSYVSGYNREGTHFSVALQMFFIDIGENDINIEERHYVD